MSSDGAAEELQLWCMPYGRTVVPLAGECLYLADFPFI